MNEAAALDTSEVRALMSRAATAADMPLSVHRHFAPDKEVRIAGCGACAACAYVATLPLGRERCYQSRAAGAQLALRQKRAIPFVCHMGFSCISVPLAGLRDGVLTLGPFVPAEAPAGVAAQARRGLDALGARRAGELPFSLDDIRVARVVSAYALAAWAAERLELALESQGSSLEEDGVAAESAGAAIKPRRATGNALHENRLPAQVASLLAAGDISAAQGVIRGLLEESPVAGKMTVTGLRARALAFAAQVVEASEAAGLSSGAAAPDFGLLASELASAKSAAELARAAGRFLKELAAPALSRTKSLPHAERDLNVAIQSRLPGPVRLQEVAAELGQTSGAVSHRLRRKYGMTFSEYVGLLRVELAKRLLRETKLSAGDVGLRVGVKDQSNFAKLFRKAAGCSPGEYRARHGRKQ